MTTNKGENLNNLGESNSSVDDKSERVEDWRNEHGQPSFDYLQSLVTDGSPSAMEKLRSVAEDLDVNFDSGTPTEELVGRIRMATRGNQNITN